MRNASDNESNITWIYVFRTKNYNLSVKSVPSSKIDSKLQVLDLKK